MWKRWGTASHQSYSPAYCWLELELQFAPFSRWYSCHTIAKHRQTEDYPPSSIGGSEQRRWQLFLWTTVAAAVRYAAIVKHIASRAVPINFAIVHDNAFAVDVSINFPSRSLLTTALLPDYAANIWRNCGRRLFLKWSESNWLWSLYFNS